MSQFYALLKDNQLRYIDLAEDIVDSTKALFVDAAKKLMSDKTERIEFDGRYVIRDNEDEISYVSIDLPTDFSNIPNNQQGITVLDFETDEIKSIFWYEEGAFLFQMFSSANLLESKYVVKFFQEEHTFNRMNEKAFIINNKIQAIYKEGNLYFKSFPSASKIFDLSANMVEATTMEVNDFGNNDNLAIDVNWLTANANNKTRRLIKMVKESGTLDAFMGMDTKKRGQLAKSVNIDITIRDDKLVLPSNVGKLNKILEFLNEDVYRGIITSNIFRTNSKRPG